MAMPAEEREPFLEQDHDGRHPGVTQTTSHVVEVNEVVVFATGRGADWWAWFLMAHRTTGRITEVAVCLGGAICHVACDSREHATWLATSMVDQHTAQIGGEGAGTTAP